VVLAAVLTALALSALAPAAASADVGVRDFGFGSAPSAPTGQKPQSKLWFNDGFWWGTLFNSFTKRYEIYRLDSNETWSPTGTSADVRPRAWTDNLWDGTHLYVVGAVYGTTTADGANLWRYRYDSASKSYSLDAGYPVSLTSTGMESVVLDKDGAGRLWITYTQGQKVWLAHSTTSEAVWTAPYVMPAPGAKTLTTDDASTIVAYNGRVGVMWSNQNDSTMYWASHADGDPDNAWTANTAIQQTEYADDHMNLKSLGTDPAGQVVGVVKTSLNGPSDPLQLVLVLDNANVWRRHTVATVGDDATRAQVAVDKEHRQLYVMYSSPCCSGGNVFYKQTSLDNVAFPSGLGTTLIQSSLDPAINNISTTKQPLSSQTGLVAIGADDNSRRYLHNRLPLSVGDGTPPDTQISSGPEGTVTSSTATFAFSATEPGSSFECTLDGGAYTACSSPRTYTTLSDSSHTFTVRATDSAGNVDPTPAVRTWTVSASAATASFTATADSYVSEASPATNYATSTTLTTDLGTGAVKRSHFRFAVSGVGGIVIGAKLRAWVTNSSTNGPAVYATSASWTESGITWANKPAPLGSPSDDKGLVPSGAWVEYDVTPLVTGDGSYDFVTVGTSTDALGVGSREAVNKPQLVLIVDNAPETSITSGPSASVGSGSAMFAFVASEASASFACSIDGSAYAACVSPKSYTGLADGAHSFAVRAVDAGTGTVDATPATRSWTVDTVTPAPPTIDLAAGSDTGRSDSDDITADTTPALTGAAEAGSTIELSAGGERLGRANTSPAGAWSFTTEALADGDHVIVATAQDAAGNLSAGASLRITVDAESPRAPTITAPADGARGASTSTTVSGTAEAAADVALLDGEQPAGSGTADLAGDFAVALSALSDGPHRFTARATDAAGNQSADSAASTLTVDTAAPETTIDAGPPDPSASSSATFTFSSSEPSAASFECKLDDGAYASCQSPVGFSDLADGAHSFAVRAKDAVGNTDPSPASNGWTIDRSALPPPTITAPAGGSVTSLRTVTVAGTAPADAGVEVLEGTSSRGTATAQPDGTWSVNVTELPDGDHTFTARTTVGGVSSGLSNSRTITVDTVAPDTGIGSAPASLSASGSADFAFSSPDGGTTFECRLDTGAFASCSSPLTYSGLADGAHDVDVRAIDAAGNVDPTPASHGWTVDTTPPESAIDSGPSGTAEPPQASFAFSSPDSGASFRCRLDGSAFAPCTSPIDYTGLAAGGHSFEVKAVDAAGNDDPTPATRSWTVRTLLFSDGFESGGFSAWTLTETGGDGTATVQSSIVRSGAFSAQLSATANIGSYATVRKTLAASQTDLFVSGDFRIAQEGVSGANVPLLRLFDAAGVRLLNVFRQNQAGDKIYVGHSSNNVLTSGRLALGTWARFEIHVLTAGSGASTIVLTMDGAEIYRTATASLGSSGIARLQIGNDTKRQTFRLQADDVEARIE